MGAKLWRLTVCIYCATLLVQAQSISSDGDTGSQQPAHLVLQVTRYVVPLLIVVSCVFAETVLSGAAKDSGSSERFGFPFSGRFPKETTSTSRRLSQTNGPSQEENQFSCTFSRAVVAGMYDERTQTWTVDDAVLEELDSDIQSIVNCSSADDVISIQASRTVTPTTSLVIPWNLTITGSNVIRTDGNEEETRVRGRTEITCPSEGTLFVSRSSSFTVSGFVISSCSGNSSVVVVDSPCQDDMEVSLVQFLNTDLTNHDLFGSGRILKAENATCSGILMHNVRLAGNKCSQGMCVFVHGARINLTNVEVLRNRNKNGSLLSHGVFSLQDSEASISSMDSRRNRIRTFHAVRSTLWISNSEFSRNSISSSYSDDEATRGVVLYAVQSSVSANASVFQNNSAVSGGVIFSTRTQLNISDCVFNGNEARNGNGSALFVQNGQAISISSSVFTKNHAEFGAGMYSSRMTVMEVAESNFTGNTCEEDGGGLFIVDGNVSIRHCDFRSNTAGDDGAAVYTDRVNLTLLHATFHYNNAAYGGACFFLRTFSGHIRNVQFIGNRAVRDAGGLYIDTKSNITISEAVFMNNVAQIDGGAFVVFGQCYIVLQRAQFVNNTAQNDGGCGYLYQAQRFIAKDIQMISNKALSRDGGSIYSFNSSGIIILNSTLQDNFAMRYGGAIRTSRSSIRLSNNTLFRRNEAHDVGGALLLSESFSFLEDLIFESNWSPHGGSVWAGNAGSTSISGCTFVNNTAVNTGGDVELSTDARVTISKTTFSGMSGQSGGSVNLEYGSSLLISSCQFRDSNSTTGGAFIVSGSNLTIVNTSFVSCSAREHGGAIFSRNSSIEVNTTRFLQNVAQNGTGGATSLHDQSRLHGSQVILSSNHAQSNGGSVHVTNGSAVLFEESSFIRGSGLRGGGISVSLNSTLLCFACNFRYNSANLGGALYIQSNGERPVVAQLQDTTFENNTAYLRGGGLYFERPQDKNKRCTKSMSNCSRVVLLNVELLNNYATYSGSGVFTTDADGVLISCDFVSIPMLDFLHQDNIQSLRPLHPNKECTSWSNNSIRTDGYTSVISTSGKTLNISISSAEDAELSVIGENVYALHNIRSGRPLPQISITVLDAFGYSLTYTSPNHFEVVLSSPTYHLRGDAVTYITNGSGIFSNITGYGTANQYTLQISPRLEGLDPVEIVLHVRQCQIGQVSTLGGEFCQDCDSLSYNFDLTKTGTCTVCPERGTCEGHYIAPRDGTWHRGPCDALIAECLLKEACIYEDRRETLQNIKNNTRTCEMEPSLAESYTSALCNEGYKGPLCGSCEADYGLSLGLRCAKCVHSSVLVLILFLVVLYLLIIASATIKSALPVNEDRISRIIERQSGDVVEWNTSRSVYVNLEIVQMMRDGHVPPEGTQSMRRQNNHTPDRQSELARESDQTKRQTIELFKVIINFLQVTATAASIDVPWTSGVLGMFEASEYIGALSTAGASASIDCIVATDSAAERSLWRMVLSLLVPGTVIFIIALFWVVSTLKNGKRGIYFVKRMALSLVVVVYISYLGLTKLAVRVFYCVEVSDSENPFVLSKNRYWAMDTAMQCYKDEHLVLMGIALVVLFFVSISFPLLIVAAFAKKMQLQDQFGWIPETMGFLYTAFNENLAFWESLVMLRKACLSVIVVFSYPLGGQVQGQLAVLVLTTCLYVHLLFTPYKNEYSRLNVYESISLFVSIVTFTLGLLLGAGKCKGIVEGLIVLVVISINSAFFLFVVALLVRSGLHYCRKVLESEDESFPGTASLWTVFKAYLSLVISKYRT